MLLMATADLHIRKAEDTALLARILQACKERGAEALLIAGDLLDRPFLDVETGSTICALLARSGIKVFLAAGNHDPLAVTSLYQNLPEGVYCFSEGISGLTIGENVRLFGYSSAREQAEDRPLQGFTAPAGGINILLAHGQAEGGREAFRPVSGEELAQSGLDLAILGHIHKGEQRRYGGCLLLVPGIPEGKGFDELGEKYIYLIDTDSMHIEPISVAEKVWREYPIDLSGCAEDGEMLARMEAVEIADHIVGRLVLVGSPAADPAAAIGVYTARYGREVKDQTDPSLSVELLCKQNTLQGAFVRRAMAELDGASPEDRPLLEEALRLGLQALKEARL